MPRSSIETLSSGSSAVLWSGWSAPDFRRTRAPRFSLPREQSELRGALDAYTGIFEAIALAQRARTPKGADEGAVMTAEVRREVEAPGVRCRTLFETFAVGDIWSKG